MHYRIRYEHLQNGFSQAMEEIPADVTVVDMSHRIGSERIPTADLVAGLPRLHPGVFGLILSFNSLGKRPIDELIAIVQALPPHITTLEFSYNGFMDMPIANLAALCLALPKTVTTISAFGEFFMLSEAKLTQLENTLPYVHTVYVDPKDVLQRRLELVKGILPNCTTISTSTTYSEEDKGINLLATPLTSSSLFTAGSNQHPFRVIPGQNVYDCSI
jgi:hypothetical protein